MSQPKPIWVWTPTLDELNAFSRKTMVSALGIRFLSIGTDSLSASMPVDERTVQPAGLLHGGANVALAETLASAAGMLVCGRGARIVGVEINANHLKSVRSGLVTGTARPVRLGSTLQVWEIRVVDEAGDLVCISRMTAAVLRDARSPATGADSERPG